MLRNSAAAAKSLQPCPTLCDPRDLSPPGSPVPGILQARTLEWVAIAFSNARKWKWGHSVVSYSSLPHGLQPTRLPRPWESPGKNTGVGCHCLLQRVKVKSQSEVAQSCPTLSDPTTLSGIKITFVKNTNFNIAEVRNKILLQRLLNLIFELNPGLCWWLRW